MMSSVSKIEEASLTRKSPTGSVAEFLGSCDLFSWQCNKQTVVANSTTEAEYVAVATSNDEIQVSAVGLTFYWFVQVFLDKQVEGMTKHKEIYVTPSHTKKVFANIKRRGKGFSGRVTPLFQTMMVQALEELERGGELRGEGVDEKGEVENERNLEIIQRPLFKLKIAKLKERVNKLEGMNKSRTPRLKRLRKVGRTARIESSEDEGLGDQEDASKHRRKITNIDADEEVTLIDETQGKNDDNLMFDTRVLDEQEVEVEKTLIEIKAAKPKAVTTAATTTTTDVTRPKARGVIVQEPKIAQRLQEELQAELEEEERLARQKVEDANIAEWDNVQAMIDADYELAARLQAQEQEELTIKERSKMFVELMYKRKKHFARLRAEEQRRKPPTKAQKRSEMSIYLKHMARYKQNQLKSKNYDEIQKLFDKAMTRVNMFIDMDTESSKKAEMVQESSSKRTGEELESDNSKKQKLNENVEAEVDNEVEMKKHMEIVPDDEVVIDAIPLATNSPIIVDWKIIKEGKMGYF
ncbi:hypothetical protein Tco_0868163 [Tanacetum coccineum]